MHTEAIITTLLDAARLLRERNSAVARQSLKAAYETAESYLRNRFDPGSDGAKVLDLATEKPESAFRKAVLIEEANLAGMSADLVIHSLIADLRGALAGFVRVARKQERVWGSAIRVNAAGSTIVTGERNGGRDSGTRGARHGSSISIPRSVSSELLASGGRPRRGAVYALLQQRLALASFLLICGARYSEAASLVNRQPEMRCPHVGSSGGVRTESSSLL